jgi:hypothetical protein
MSDEVTVPVCVDEVDGIVILVLDCDGKTEDDVVLEALEPDDDADDDIGVELVR